MLNLWRSLNNFGKAVFLTLVCIFVIFLAEVRADYTLRNVLNTISTPLVSLFHSMSAGVVDIGDFIGSIGKMREENILLRDRVEVLEVENTQIGELTRENQLLRDQLNLEESTGFSLLNARVISQEPIGVQKMIMINRGQKQGVATGMPIVVSEGLLVGVVTETYDQTAKVVLLLDSTVEVPARVQKSRASGMVRGQQLGQGLIMELIPQEAEVYRGNRVITSGVGANYPAGLLIGYVQTVEQEESDIFQTATILPAVDFERVEDVMVIIAYE